ncbi:unnamed protein product [Urochloa humidicola]
MWMTLPPALSSSVPRKGSWNLWDTSFHVRDACSHCYLLGGRELTLLGSEWNSSANRLVEGDKNANCGSSSRDRK